MSAPDQQAALGTAISSLTTAIGALQPLPAAPAKALVHCLYSSPGPFNLLTMSGEAALKDFKIPQCNLG